MAWIKNEGKQPVDYDVIVRVKFNNGVIKEHRPAGTWDWNVSETRPYAIAEYELLDDIRTDESISA